MTPELRKRAEEAAADYSRRIVKTAAFSDKGQIVMGFPAWHARQRNCLRLGFLAGVAWLYPQLEEALGALRMSAARNGQLSDELKALREKYEQK